MTQTVGHYLAMKLKELYSKQAEIDESIEEVVMDLCGAVINYKDYQYCMIDHIDGGEVDLYCENEDGERDSLIITLDELIKCL
ncbi:hypothetical protein NST33_18130 [Paenibacillus sp. FSL L8-0435]|uniref:hypothetical protein n=1 Tax=Paenibacillus sp. FSL L8-0435 TaxID=2954618 RepID=UPI0030D85190